MNEDDASKTALLNAVGHQLAKPMTSMQGLAQTIAERGGQLPSDARRDPMERGVGASGRMTETLDELLGVTRLTPGRVVLDLEKAPVGDLIERARVHAEIDPGRLRVDAPSLDLIADHGRLSHAVTNLLTNAVRYGGDAWVEDREGGGTVAVLSVPRNGPDGRGPTPTPTPSG